MRSLLFLFDFNQLIWNKNIFLVDTLKRTALQDSITLISYLRTTYFLTAEITSLFLNFLKRSVYVSVFMKTSENSCSSSADSFWAFLCSSSMCTSDIKRVSAFSNSATKSKKDLTAFQRDKVQSSRRHNLSYSNFEILLNQFGLEMETKT